jgi:predicted DNA-binding protein (MmcQ/YjbR family)/CheY-like chemotaxis protein
MDPARIAAKLRQLALRYPETYEEAPWGDRVVKVRGKIFFFCGARDGELSLSVKLPQSSRAVLTEEWARPTPYGLGKSGWVTATFARAAEVPEARVAEWIGESYRAVAPKRLAAAAPVAAKPARAKSAPAKRLRARVMLVCQDPLRIERAARGLGEHGITVAATASADDVRGRLGELDAVIIDVGRQKDDGLQLAAEIDQSDHEISIFIVGIRDNAVRKQAAAAATSADLFRQPPGDPATVAAIAELLARHHPRT